VDQVDRMEDLEDSADSEDSEVRVDSEVAHRLQIAMIKTSLKQNLIRI
jgi:hypothetical protein